MFRIGEFLLLSGDKLSTLNLLIFKINRSSRRIPIRSKLLNFTSVYANFTCPSGESLHDRYHIK